MINYQESRIKKEVLVERNPFTYPPNLKGQILSHTWESLVKDPHFAAPKEFSRVSHFTAFEYPLPGTITSLQQGFVPPNNFTPTTLSRNQ